MTNHLRFQCPQRQNCADGVSTSLGALHFSHEILQLDRITRCFCTGYFAAEIISSFIRDLTDIQAEAFIASEFLSFGMPS